MTTKSFTRVIAQAGVDTYTIPFQFLNPKHVKVLVNNAFNDFSVINGSQIKFNMAPVAGAEVLIYRQTPLEPLVTFSGGTVLLEEKLNIANKQALFLAQEQADRIAGLVPADVQDIVNQVSEGFTADVGVFIAQLQAAITALQGQVTTIGQAVGTGSFLTGEIKNFIRSQLPDGWTEIFTDIEPEFQGLQYTVRPLPDLRAATLNSVVRKNSSYEVAPENQFVGLLNNGSQLVLEAFTPENYSSGDDMAGSSVVSTALSTTGLEAVWSANRKILAFANEKAYITHGKNIVSVNMANGVTTIERSTDIVSSGGAGTLTLETQYGGGRLEANGDLSFYARFAIPTLPGVTANSKAWIFVTYNIDTGALSGKFVAFSNQTAKDYFVANSLTWMGLTLALTADVVTASTAHPLTYEQTQQAGGFISGSRFYAAVKNSYDPAGAFTSTGRAVYVYKIDADGRILNEYQLGELSGTNFINRVFAYQNSFGYFSSVTVGANDRMTMRLYTDPNGEFEPTPVGELLTTATSTVFGNGESIYPIGKTGNFTYVHKLGGISGVGGGQESVWALGVNALNGRPFPAQVVTAFKE